MPLRNNNWVYKTVAIGLLDISFYNFHSIKSIFGHREPFADVIQNRCSQKFRKFHRKTPVLNFLFNKVVTLLKRDSNTVFSCETCEIFKNICYFRINLLAACFWPLFPFYNPENIWFYGVLRKRKIESLARNRLTYYCNILYSVPQISQ